MHDELLERDTVLDSYFWLRPRDPALARDYLRFWRRNPLIRRDYEEILGGEAEWLNLREQEFRDTCGDATALPESPAEAAPVQDMWGKDEETSLPPVDEWRRDQ